MLPSPLNAHIMIIPNKKDKLPGPCPLYEGWMTDGPASTSASATERLLVIIMYTSPARFWGMTQLPSVRGWNWVPPLFIY